jgi:hypothetical protein
MFGGAKIGVNTMNENDRELLELAAKAAGITYKEYLPDPDSELSVDEEFDALINGIWDPLTDDGDAFRLMVKLNLNLYVDCAFDNVKARMVCAENNVGYDPNYRSARQDGVTDPLAAARRVIVELAAKLGKEMK